MAYTFKNTEKNLAKGSDHETKSLLYLVGMRDDSKDIDILTVDCFNDVNGSDEKFCNIIDVQSKNYAKFYPASIGESLLTLYKNYVSDFYFSEYLLFCNTLDSNYLIDSSINYFGFENIAPSTKELIKCKLNSVVEEKLGASEIDLIDDFLNVVKIYQDSNTGGFYAKKIARFKNTELLDDTVYDNIFKEIRKLQISLKMSNIENVTLNHPKEVLELNRHITNSEVRSMVVSKLIGYELFTNFSVPSSFIPYLINSGIDFSNIAEIDDIINDCAKNLSYIYFDKNSNSKSWEILENIINLVIVQDKDDAINVFEELMANISELPHYLNKTTLHYLIAIIITGKKNANN
ncbi:TPA: hypothetical protein ACOJPN_004951 [Vibrio harveyi]|uniref:hypothetical protein n=1 Tax=Vibrio harveyi TaxID=669 RepID=UPI00390B7598